MKHIIKKLFVCIIIITSILVISNYSNAHKGRIDSNGGHRDNKNVSGLGSYHYHCGGHPAHLHPNGVCPYSSSSSSTKDNTSYESSKNKNSATNNYEANNKKDTTKNNTLMNKNSNSLEDDENINNAVALLTAGLLGGAGFLGYKKSKK